MIYTVTIPWNKESFYEVIGLILSDQTPVFDEPGENRQ